MKETDPALVQETNTEPSPEKPGVKAKRFFGALLGTLVIILIAVLCIFAAHRARRDTVYYYIAGGELYRSNDSGKGFMVSSAFIAGEAALNPAASELLAEELLAKVFESADGKYVFYTDNNSVTGSGSTYYCRKTDSTGSPLRVDSGLSDIKLSGKGSHILYKKGNALYRFDPASGSSLIHDDAARFVASEALDMVCVIDSQNSLFFKIGGADAELLENDVTSVGCISGSGTVWFVKNEVLYRKAIGVDKQKICSEVCGDGFLLPGKTPDFYILTYKKTDIPVSSLLKDDLAGADSLLSEPVKPTEPVRESYPTGVEYEAALAEYRSKLESYPAALDAYNAKLRRDGIRKSAESGVISRISVTLNYCDGETLTPVAENIIAAAFSGVVSGDKSLQKTGLSESPLDNGAGAVIYLKTKDKALPKVSMEQFENYDSLLAGITAELEPSCILEAAKGTRRIYLDAGEVYGVCCGKDCFYCFDNPGLSSEGFDVCDLRRIDLSTGTIETVDTKVSPAFFDPENCLYYKEPRADFSSASLFVNGKRIGEKVLPGSAKAAGKTVCFLSDYSGDIGTLSLYNGKKITFSTGGVHAFALTENGTPVFIGEYHGPGDNILFHGTDAKEIVGNAAGVK